MNRFAIIGTLSFDLPMRISASHLSASPFGIASGSMSKLNFTLWSPLAFVFSVTPTRRFGAVTPKRVTARFFTPLLLAWPGYHEIDRSPEKQHPGHDKNCVY